MQPTVVLKRLYYLYNNVIMSQSSFALNICFIIALIKKSKFRLKIVISEQFIFFEYIIKKIDWA